MNIARGIALALLLSPVLAGAEPVALVLDVQGDVSPAVRAFDEIEPDTKLTLAPGASLTVEHYTLCQQVSLRGGALLVEAEALDLAEASFVARRPVECPKIVQLPSPKVNAGVIVRSAPSELKRWTLPRIGLTPAFFITGSDKIDSLRIERDGEEIATLPVIDRQARWPESARDLRADERYELILSDGVSDGVATHRIGVITDGEAYERLVLRLPPGETASDN